MHADATDIEISRRLRNPATFAFTFFLVAAGLLVTAGGSAWLAVRFTPSLPIWNRIAFMVSFVSSTGLLSAGSVQLTRASSFVRRERQSDFRRCLASALLIGTSFVSVQTYGLQSLMNRQTEEMATGVKYAAFAFILLHAVHVVVALLFLVFIYLRALADRYDHEYSWGVTFCGWFWHGLGIIWIAIVAVFMVAGTAALAQ